MPEPPKPDPDRLAREAAALRENLRRRKAQHRARTQPEPAKTPDPNGRAPDSG